jgi:dCMP deaminase
MITDRPTWDQTWMAVCQRIAQRSADPVHKVGAIIITDDNTQMLALGYNGDHAGGPNERESDDPGCSGFLHAEINALIKCDFNTTKRKVMYVTLSPCRMCAKAIINARISEVVYGDQYRDERGIALLREANIVVRALL